MLVTMQLLLLLVSCFSLLPFSCSELSLKKINFSNYNPMNLIKKFRGYGKSWMYFPNGMGLPQIAKLTTNGVIPDLYRPIEIYVTFHLYTRLNPFVSQIIEDYSINDSNFAVSKPTKVCIHGWLASYESELCQKIKDNFLKVDDLNVILVDWNKIAQNPVYLISAKKTTAVGDMAAKMIDSLVENGANLKDIHLIGHSLGAHVAGRIGQSIISGKIPRITGLDPALPGFEIIALGRDKLDKSDAEFVDVIHSCGGVLGYYSPLGHVDFYPNGGVPRQPGCFGLPQMIEACSHTRAWEYFAASILNPTGFMSTLCDSWSMYNTGKCKNNIKIPMGIAATKVDGTYFWKTNAYERNFLNKLITFISNIILFFFKHVPFMG